MVNKIETDKGTFEFGSKEEKRLISLKNQYQTQIEAYKLEIELLQKALLPFIEEKLKKFNK